MVLVLVLVLVLVGLELSYTRFDLLGTARRAREMADSSWERCYALTCLPRKRHEKRLYI
jgi:hypothetical protein